MPEVDRYDAAFTTLNANKDVTIISPPLCVLSLLAGLVSQDHRADYTVQRTQSCSSNDIIPQEILLPGINTQEILLLKTTD